MRARREIPISRIQDVLGYDPDTGRLVWKVKVADKVVVGREAGNATGRRDVRISVDGVLYQAHRLAWVIMTSSQPPALIDHINRDHRDNRWANLRAASTSQNGANRKAQANSTTKIKGVHHYPESKKPWLARMSCRGEVVLNRYFSTQEEAARAYAEAAIEHFGLHARVK